MATRNEEEYLVGGYTFEVTLNKARIEDEFNVELTLEEFLTIAKGIEASFTTDNLRDEIRYWLEVREDGNLIINEEQLQERYKGALKRADEAIEDFRLGLIEEAMDKMKGEPKKEKEEKKNAGKHVGNTQNSSD